MKQKANSNILADFAPIVAKINSIDYSGKSDAELMEAALQFKEMKPVQKTLHDLDNLLPEYFALIKEVAFRTIGLKAFDTQLMAGIALHRCKLAEMQTGEGKTLAAVFPVSLNALTGTSVHVLTFNDYLAKRDFNWMGPIYNYLGLTVGYISEKMSLDERLEMYKKDVVYLTAKEAGFDYLKNFLCYEKEKFFNLNFDFAIVDEADSILIDEARIPLVIAGDQPIETFSEELIAKNVKTLQLQKDVEIDEVSNTVNLTDEGTAKIEEALKIDNIYDDANFHMLAMVNCALQARHLLILDKDYVVKNEDIKIIDQYTGRISDNRHYPDNLHNAVRVKEGLPAKSNGTIMGSITLQHFISKYKRLSGMTGTALSSENELFEMYNIEVVSIPSHKICIRKDFDTQVYTHKTAKDLAILNEIKAAHLTGQPILIGTSSVSDSEDISETLTIHNIKHVVLNAKNDQTEAEIIAKAGAPYAVTVSANMAGRGVDIKLGGSDEKDRAQVVASGGLYVIGTDLHESVRIDNQLRGRAGRQGDVGKSRFFACLQDELMVKYQFAQLLPKYPVPQSEPITSKYVLREVARLQRISQGANQDTRLQLYKYSTIIDQQREIITTERNKILFDEDMPDAKRQLYLYFINKHWIDYLDYMSYLREGIHLSLIGGRNPLDIFHMAAIDSFDEMKEKINADVESNSDLQQSGLSRPVYTMTYLVNDNMDQFIRNPFAMKSFSTSITGMVFSFTNLFKKKPKQ